MTKEELKNYRNHQIWIKDQIEYIETQRETIHHLNSILSGMPRGSKKIYDTEAESIANLEMYFKELMEKIIEEKEKQKEIVSYINTMQYPYKNILFEVYIQGKSLVRVANEMNYSYENICRKHSEALKKWEKKESGQ